MKNLNEEAGFRSAIERGIDFTREDYEAKRELSNNELIDFDDFVKNVAESCDYGMCDSGTIEDAIFIANDAYSKL